MRIMVGTKLWHSVALLKPKLALSLFQSKNKTAKMERIQLERWPSG